MRYRLRKTVAMIGMMGAGKTAIGTALARTVGAPFLDSDAEIERAAARSIAEIFERDGEPFFRDREREVIARLLGGPACVLSTGGGAYLNAETRALVNSEGVALWLRADLELLWSRVRHKDTRPLLRTPDPKATLAALKAAREPVYAEAALVVDADPGLTIEAMCARAVEVLLTRPDVLERSAA